MNDLKDLPLTLTVPAEYTDLLLAGLPERHDITAEIEVAIDVNGYDVHESFETEVEVDLREEARQHFSWNDHPSTSAEYSIKDVRRAWVLHNARSTKEWVTAVLDEAVTTLLQEAAFAGRTELRNTLNTTHNEVLEQKNARLKEQDKTIASKDAVIRQLQLQLNEYNVQR